MATTRIRSRRATASTTPAWTSRPVCASAPRPTCSSTTSWTCARPRRRCPLVAARPRCSRQSCHNLSPARVHSHSVMSTFHTKLLTVESAPFDCSRLPDGHYSADDCVSYYFSCSGKKATQSDCPAGLVFDPKTLVCDSKEFVVSCGGVPRPAEPSAPAEQPQPAPEPVASTRRREFFGLIVSLFLNIATSARPSPTVRPAPPRRPKYDRTRRAVGFYNFPPPPPAEETIPPAVTRATRPRYAFRTRRPRITTVAPVCVLNIHVDYTYMGPCRSRYRPSNPVVLRPSESTAHHTVLSRQCCISPSRPRRFRRSSPL